LLADSLLLEETHHKRHNIPETFVSVTLADECASLLLVLMLPSGEYICITIFLFGLLVLFLEKFYEYNTDGQFLWDSHRNVTAPPYHNSRIHKQLVSNAETYELTALLLN